MSSRRLVLFTDSYPYGSTEPFLGTELRHLAAAFDRVEIVPRRYGRSRQPRALPPGVSVQPPLVPDSRGLTLLRGVFAPGTTGPILAEAKKARILSSPHRFMKWMEAASLVRVGLQHSLVKQLRVPAKEPTVCYFYWGLGASWLAPFIHESNTHVARFHGYDVYEDRPAYRGYMPFREVMLNALKHAVFVSEDGRDYVMSRYPGCGAQSHVFRLGVEGAESARTSDDGVLRLLSCSAAVPVKRLHLVVQALAGVSRRVQWTHIGGGPLLQELERAALSLPASVDAVFTGPLAHDAVYAYYREHPVDLFINVSESEGVPVAVMEALAHGVPVLATDVGGTRELVDDQVGRLLPADICAEDLATVISESGVVGRREAARQRWDQRANEEKNEAAFATFLAASTVLVPSPRP